MATQGVSSIDAATAETAFKEITTVASPTLFFPSRGDGTSTRDSNRFGLPVYRANQTTVDGTVDEPTYKPGSEPASSVLRAQAFSSTGAPPLDTDWGQAHYKRDLDAFTARYNHASKARGSDASSTKGNYLAIVSLDQKRAVGFSSSTGKLIHAQGNITKGQLVNSAICPIGHRKVNIQNTTQDGQPGTLISYDEAPKGQPCALSKKSGHEESAAGGKEHLTLGGGPDDAESGLPPSQLSYVNGKPQGLGTSVRELTEDNITHLLANVSGTNPLRASNWLDVPANLPSRPTSSLARERNGLQMDSSREGSDN
ncbi:hypothetical protein IAT40_007072 [Kwoniella sp. CBS 6097]